MEDVFIIRKTASGQYLDVNGVAWIPETDPHGPCRYVWKREEAMPQGIAESVAIPYMADLSIAKQHPVVFMEDGSIVLTYPVRNGKKVIRLGGVSWKHGSGAMPLAMQAE